VAPGNEHDLVVAKLNLDFVAGVQIHSVADRLWDHDLALGANLRSHTV
jgi:hypothetical protein